MILRAAAACAAVIALHAAAGTPVAFVADVAGSATIEGDGRLTFLAELEPGTRLFLGTGARAAITFARSGSEYTATGPGEFLVAAEELRAEKGAAPMKRAVPILSDAASVTRAARSATASLRMRSARPNVAPASAANALLYPVDSRIATLQPVLRWNPADAQAADVIVHDENGKPVWTGKATGGSIQPALKLSAATRYRWTVKTAKGVVGEAGFETLAAEPLAKAEAARAAARSFSERVTHALLLQELGAAQDAHAAWRELSRERPDVPELAALAR
jgi:hypothetical protein